MIFQILRQKASNYVNYFHKRPFLMNCINYGGLGCLAEFTQQTIEQRIVLVNEKRESYDFEAIGRYGFLATCVLSPVLFVWYGWLDRRFPGAAGKTVFKKLILDTAVMAVPFYVTFYVGMSIIEGKKGDEIFNECRTKILPTTILGLIFWTPAQTLNFWLIPPIYRVTFMGFLSFIELNGLCFMKRLD